MKWETKSKVGESCWEATIILGWDGEVGSTSKVQAWPCLPALQAEDLRIGVGSKGSSLHPPQPPFNPSPAGPRPRVIPVNFPASSLVAWSIPFRPHTPDH